jgi:hypothetical protein
VNIVNTVKLMSATIFSLAELNLLFERRWADVRTYVRNLTHSEDIFHVLADGSHAPGLEMKGVRQDETLGQNEKRSCMCVGGLYGLVAVPGVKMTTTTAYNSAQRDFYSCPVYRTQDKGQHSISSGYSHMQSLPLTQKRAACWRQSGRGA